ncbi:MAG: ABC transporter permease, partial [Spirochaetia bacterium]
MRRYISLGAIAVFLILFFFLPLGIVFFRGVFAGEFPLSKVAAVLSSAYFLRIIGFTFFQAAVSACFALVLGLPGAFLVSRTTGRLKSVLNALATVPFILPAILVVLGFIIFFGNNGILNRALMSLTGSSSPPLRILYNFGAIILAHGFYNFPVVLRTVSGVWETVPVQERFAARALGAGKFREFRTVVLPRLLPPIAAAWFLSFLFCYLSFAIILVLAGGPQFTTMEVEIYRLTVTAVNIEEAAALGAVQVVLTASMMWVFTRFSSGGSQVAPERIQLAPPEKSSSRLLKTGLVIYVIFAFLVVGGPILSVVIRSFQEPATRAGDMLFTLRWYRELFTSSGNSLEAMANTFLYAV